MMEKQGNNRTWLFVVLIIVAAFVGCGLGGLVGGVAGYFAGRRSAHGMRFRMPFDPDMRPGPFVPQPDMPRMPDMPRIPEQLPRLMEEGGAFVLTVISGSPAEEAGLRPGDIITEVDGDSLLTDRELADVIAEYEPGDWVRLTVSRGERERMVRVKLGEHPDEPDGRPWLGITYRTVPAGFNFEWPERPRREFK